MGRVNCHWSKVNGHEGKNEKSKEGICFSVTKRNRKLKSEMETVKCNLKTMRSKMKVVRGEITIVRNKILTARGVFKLV